MEEIIFEAEDFFALTVLGEAPVGFDEVDFAGVLCFDFDIVSKIMVAVLIGMVFN